MSKGKDVWVTVTANIGKEQFEEKSHYGLAEAFADLGSSLARHVARYGGECQIKNETGAISIKVRGVELPAASERPVDEPAGELPE